MKFLVLYIRYISLLLFSGLILPFFYSVITPVNIAETQVQQKVQMVNSYSKPVINGLTIFTDVVTALFPALKK